MRTNKDRGYEGIINELQTMVEANKLLHGADQVDAVTFTAKMIALRIENEKLLALHQQNDILRNGIAAIVEAIEDIPGPI